MAYDSKKTHNYEAVYNSNGTVKNYIGDIDISDIDTDTPISLKDDNNNRLTIGNVFGGLNKIIKAIKNKFSEIDEIETRRRGMSGNKSIAAKQYTFSFPSKTQIANLSMDDSSETVTIDGYYTHGYLKYNSKSYYVSSLLHNDAELNSKNIQYSEVGGSVLNHPGTYKLIVRISHPNDYTTVLMFITKVEPNWYNNGSYYPLDGKTWTRPSESVEYELF